MYLVGQLVKAHPGEPPQWDIVALRWTYARAIKDCGADENRMIMKVKIGLNTEVITPIHPGGPKPWQ